eukprot:COSAG05_NODE_11679_length_502_cov_1.148883_1_plen_78_part_00
MAAFMQKLLVSNPFGTSDKAPYVDFKAPSQSKVVAITQRQLAFVVANALMGNSLAGTADGLTVRPQPHPVAALHGTT